MRSPCWDSASGRALRPWGQCQGWMGRSGCSQDVHSTWTPSLSPESGAPPVQQWDGPNKPQRITLQKLNFTDVHFKRNYRFSPSWTFSRGMRLPVWVLCRISQTPSSYCHPSPWRWHGCDLPHWSILRRSYRCCALEISSYLEVKERCCCHMNDDSCQAANSSHKYTF